MSEEEVHSRFRADTEQDVAYWKRKFEERDAEFAEYEQTSKELEGELERELDHKEKRLKELEALNAKLTSDLGYFKVSLLGGWLAFVANSLEGAT